MNRFILFVCGWWCGLFLTSLHAQTDYFSRRLHFDRPVAILTGIAVAPDGYWANGITSWPSSPFTTANLFVKFDWEGQPLEVKVVEQVDKSYETWNTGLRLTHEADALVSAGVSFGWDEINQSGFAQFLLMNYDLTGDTVWTRNYTSFIYPNVWLRANGLLVLEDGYLLIGSAAEDPIPPDVSQMIVLRLDSAGEVLWQRAFHPDTQRGEEGVSALRSANGGFVLGGEGCKGVGGYYNKTVRK